MVQFNKLNPLQQSVQQNGVNGQPKNEGVQNAPKDFSIFMQSKQHVQKVSKDPFELTPPTTTAKPPENPPQIELPQPKPTHTIEKGNTFWGIAKEQLGKDATNTEIANFVKKIIAANPGINPNKLKIGTKINMPEVETPKPPESLMAKDIPITPGKVRDEICNSMELEDLTLNTSASDYLKS